MKSKECVIGIARDKERDNGAQTILEEIIAKRFTKLVSNYRFRKTQEPQEEYIKICVYLYMYKYYTYINIYIL